MVKYITRSQTTSKIYACVVEMVNGELVARDLPPFDVHDKISIERAIKEVRKQYELKKDDVPIIRTIEEDSKVYGMPVDDFMKYAVEMPRKPVVRKDENQTKL